MKAPLFVQICILFYCLLGSNVKTISQTVLYTPSDAIIGNPERGLQKYSITGANYSVTPGANNLAVNTLNQWKNSSDQVRVVFRYFLLEDFINSDINSTYLNNIQTDFDHIRAAGFKVIVRFSYSNARGSEPQQPSQAQILRHITQIEPILFDNRDVIFSHQAGFIGTWGEWYYTNSTEFGTEGNISSTQWSNRKEILDAMLAFTPDEIPLQVRYVGIKTRLYGMNPLTEQSAYQNTAQARIGFYNDAFLNNWGDQGTYSVNSECEDPRASSEYNYLANETLYLPMTGETNGLNPCNNGLRTKGDNVVAEMNATNWTCINRDYYIPFWDQLIDDGDFEEVLRGLGYRFVLKSSTVEVNGLDFDISLDLENVGFARVFKERPVYLVLQDVENGDIFNHLLDTDIRSWTNEVYHSENINPGLSGTFQLYLWIPDKNSNLQSDPNYAIQLANENMWDPSSGYNDLMQTIELSCLVTRSTDVQIACDSFTWIDDNTYSSSTDTATYTLTGSNGCDSMVALDLTILNSIAGTDVQTACNSYTWIDGNTYTASNNSATYTLTGSNGCDSIVQLDLTINKVSDLSISTSDTAILVNNLNADYQWLDCLQNYQEIPGETDRSFFPEQNGEYAVELLEDGCLDTSQCVLFTLVGLQETEKDGGLELFPNPAHELLFIQSTANHDSHFHVLNATGKIVKREVLVEGQASVDLSAFPAGPYFIRMLGAQGMITRLFIKL